MAEKREQLKLSPAQKGAQIPTFGLEQFDGAWRSTVVLFEDLDDLFLGHSVRCVEEMQYFGRRTDSVLARRFRIREPVISVAHEIFKRWRTVEQFERLLYVVQERLLRVGELHLLAKELGVVQK